MAFNVFSLIGEYGITAEDGQKLFDTVNPELVSRHAIEIDFKGVRVFASPFFNASLGRVLKDLSLDEFRKLVKCTNLPPVGMSVLERVLANSEEYYRDPESRRALDDVLNAVSEQDDAGQKR